jgi:hypothetical protein
MLRAFFCSIALLCIVNLSNAQVPDTLDCPHPDRDSVEAAGLPWYGNNDYLENLLDSIGYPPSGGNQRIIGTNQVRYHVPVKFWVYRNSAGTGGPTIAQLQAYIDNLNRFFNVDNNTFIGFYMKCTISFINNNNYLEVDDSEGFSLVQSNKELGAMNIHIANTLPGANGVFYRTRRFGGHGIFLSQATYTNPLLASTIAHEAGHFFNLDHTHQYSDRGICRRESISRTRTWPGFPFCFMPGSWRVCETTGDFLRDTPADHDLSDNFFCFYWPTGLNDLWGDSYDTPPAGSFSPDPTNLMSYNWDRSCRDFFSRMQIAVMIHSIERGLHVFYRNAWKDLKSEYDEYEPDNESVTARPIQVYEVQERNFHQQLSSTLFTNNWSQCDADWARFTVPCNGNYIISTSAMPFRTLVNTRLTLYNSALTQLAQNDNISGSNLYSSVTQALVTGQTYFVRVENLSGNATGYYRLRVVNQNANPDNVQITGTDFICGANASYTISGHPAGSTINWNVTPGGLVNVSPTTGTSTTLTKLSSGNPALIATVSNFCGNATFNVTKNLVTGDVQNYPTVEQVGGTSVCYDSYTDYTFVVTNPDPNFGYKWGYQRPDGSTVMIGGASAGPSTSPIFVFPSGGSFYVFAIASSIACGDGLPGFFDVYVNQPWEPCYGRFYNLTLSPNPVKEKLTVTISDETREVKSLAKTEAVEMMLYDINTTTIIRRWIFKNDQDKFSLDVTGIKKGQYILQVRKGKYVQAKHLLIN